ncbi:MAG: rod shape-determining protein MreC [Candidatus Babeliales bacterium]
MLNKWLKQYAVWFVCSAVFFFGLHRFFAATPGIVEYAASYITYPFLIMQSYVTRSLTDFFAEREKSSILRAAVEKLEEQLINAQSQMIVLESQLDFAKDTYEVREFAERYETEHAILSHVLVRQLTEQQQLYVIDKGSNQGVTVDMVAVYKNCLLGRVAMVYPTYSKIQLITDIGCKVAAFCGSTQAQGIHEGRNNAQESALNFVSHLETICVGDLVISSGSGLVFPRGFMLGSIKEAKIDGLYYAITITPPLDLHNVEYVYLIKK